MLPEILWMVFFASAAIQFLYLLIIYGRLVYGYRLPTYAEDRARAAGVTVVVAARNERENLENLIPMLSLQTHPKFEILIVNDRSTDGTDTLLSEMMHVYPRLRTVTVNYTPEHVTAKKYALTLGIKVARYDIVLLTDADCRPVSNDWIRLMSYPIRADGKTIVLGHGAYKMLPGFLNRFIQYETIFTAMNYFSFALWRSPLIGVGRNLCYHRQMFMENKAFKSIWHINGGDDDLFVNLHADKHNTAVVIHPESITVSQPKTSWGAYFLQKKRHFHAGKYYRPKNKLKLGIYTLSHLMFWASAFSLLFVTENGEPIAFVTGLIILRAIAQMIAFRGTRKKLEGIGKVYWTMFFDLLYLGYFWVIGSTGYLSKKIKWK